MIHWSILSPILYVVYANDLLSTLSDNVIIANADDVTLANNEYMVEEVDFNLQTLLNAVYSWSTVNALCLNVPNCCIMQNHQFFVLMRRQILTWSLVIKNYH